MKTILFLLAILCLSSCFEIREEVNMKADGSGEMLFTLDLSQSRDNVRKYLKMEKVEGVPVPKPAQVDAAISQLKKTLSTVSGISTVVTKSDWSNYVFTVSSRFAHPEALNKALEAVQKEFDKHQAAPANALNFSYNNSQFRRSFEMPTKDKEFQKLTTTQRYLLETARLTSIYRFEKNIKSFSNKKAKLSPSGKSILLQLPLADLVKGTGTVANTISF